MNTHNPRSFMRRERRVETVILPRAEYHSVAVRTMQSENLFQGEREIGIDHGGSLYRLKITRQGKLILNK